MPVDTMRVSSLCKTFTEVSFAFLIQEVTRDAPNEKICMALKVFHGESLEIPNTFYVQSRNLSVELHAK